MKNLFDKNNTSLLVFTSFTILIIIILGIIYSSSILRKETINNQLTISNLNAQYLAEDLNQKINNIELLIENIASVVNLEEENTIINKNLEDTLSRYPLIRSINILKNNNIVYSSNIYNIGLFIKDNDFSPKPMFSENILRVSSPWLGRDFISGSNILANDDIPDTEWSFIPILKKTYINENQFTVIINLNSDFILNSFIKRNIYNQFDIELLRIDNLLLLSNNEKKSLGQKKRVTSLLKNAFRINNSVGIEKLLNNEKYISAYSIFEDFPFIVAVHLNYEKSLLSWNKKSYEFFIISIGIVIICMIIVLILILLYRKEKEKELNLHKQQIEDQEKFKHLFHDSHFLTVVLNKNGEILDINESALNFLNIKLQRVRNTSFWDLNCWGYKEHRYIKRLFNSKDPIINLNEEINAIDRFKKDTILEMSVYTINKDSDDYKYIAIGQDISQRKEREKKLKQAYTVFENTRDGIMITDKDTNIIDVNQAFERITGYTKNEILGKNTRILKSNIHDGDFYNNLWNSLNENRYWEGEITNIRKDKVLYTEWLTINSILDRNTEVVSYIAVFSDITHEKEKEFLLKEKETLLFQQSKLASMGEMIENIAHQWRQPLSVISTAATGTKLQKELGLISEEDEMKNLDAINNQAQYLSETIEDFRKFLKTDKELEKFNTNDTINSALKLISSKLKNRNIQIINDNEDIFINGMKNEFIQVIINIINNAKDALEESDLENKYIFINSYMDGSSVSVLIKNNGGIIPEDIINRIFEPYFTTKHQSQGTGIGLYMSEEIIKNHMNGSLTVKNQEFIYKGEKYFGPCFEIRIPI